jgi:hypothetical protein
MSPADQARHDHSREMLRRLVAMGFRVTFEPRTPEGYATEMLRVLRAVGANRARLFAGAHLLVGSRQAIEGQRGLFNAGSTEIKLPAAKPWTPLEVIQHEAEALGWPVQSHPLYQPLRNAIALLGEAG